jgi:hypothetical protein
MKILEDCFIRLKTKNGETPEEESRAYLKEAAVETIFHVALTRVLTEDLAKKFGISRLDAGGILSKAAVDLVAEIRGLK